MMRPSSTNSTVASEVVRRGHVHASSQGGRWARNWSRSVIPGKAGNHRLPAPTTPFLATAISRFFHTIDSTSRTPFKRRDPRQPRYRFRTDLRIVRQSLRQSRNRFHPDNRETMRGEEVERGGLQDLRAWGKLEELYRIP